VQVQEEPEGLGRVLIIIDDEDSAETRGLLEAVQEGDAQALEKLLGHHRT